MGSFCRLVRRSRKSEKMRPLSSGLAVFEAAGLPFSHLFSYFLQAFFHAVFRNAFLPSLSRFWPPNGLPFGLHFRRFSEISAAKMGSEIEARKLMNFDDFCLGSAAGGGAV